MKKTFTLFTASLFSLCVNAQWDTLNTQTSTDFNSISFPDNLNGLAVGKNPTTGRGTGYYTADAGQTWTAANMGSNPPAINDVEFFGLYLGYAVGDSGTVFTCNTLGMTISPPNQLGTEDLNCIFIVRDTVAYIGGDNGVMFRSPDFGSNWYAINTQTTQPIRDIYFLDQLVGWIVCDGGYIGYTIDGGQTWTAQPQDHLGFLQSKGISFAGTNAYVVGNSGNMLISVDAGLTWDIFSPVTTQNLSCVRFSNNLAGVICGDNGTIFRTYVGGPNWANETMSYVTEKLNKVCFPSDSVAYICGKNGRILKSNIDISSVQPNVNFTMNANAYPNPFETELRIMLRLEKTSAVQLAVMDISGRVVLQENLGEINPGENLITPAGISSLVSGMYIVQITTSYGSVALPVVRQ